MNFIFKYSLHILFFLTFLVRITLWIIFLKNAKIGADSAEYLGVGQNIVDGLGFWNNERGGEFYFSEPVYPLLIAFFMFIFENTKTIIFAQTIISCFSSIIFFKIMLDLHFPKKMSFFATIILILHPYINYWNALYMPESLRLFALLLMIKFAIKLLKKMTTKDVIYYGLISGFASLVRFPFGFMVPLFAIYFYFIKENTIKNIIVYIFSFLLVLSPWYIRNYSIQGSISKYSILDRFSDGLKPETIYRITDQEKYYKEMGGNRGVMKDNVIDHELRKGNRVILLSRMFLAFKRILQVFPHRGNFSFLSVFQQLFLIFLFYFIYFGFYKLKKDNMYDIIFILSVPIIILTLVHTISNTHASRYSLPLVPIQIIGFYISKRLFVTI